MMINTTSRVSSCRIGSRTAASPMAVQRRVVLARNDANKGVSKIQEGSKELFESGKKGVTDVTDSAKDTWNNATNATKNAGADARDAVNEKAQQAADAANNAGKSVHDAGAGILGKAAAAVKDGASAVERAASH